MIGTILTGTMIGLGFMLAPFAARILLAPIGLAVKLLEPPIDQNEEERKSAERQAANALGRYEAEKAHHQKLLAAHNAREAEKKRELDESLGERLHRAYEEAKVASIRAQMAANSKKDL